MAKEERLKAHDLADQGKTPSQIFDLAREKAREYVLAKKLRGGISISPEKEGDIPSIHLARRTLPEVWEDAILAVMAFGREVHTYYDPVDKEGNYISFPSQEATVMMHIQEPFGEPRFHKAFLGGWMGFGDYQAEIEGVKNHWMLDPKVVVDMIRKGRFAEIQDDERWKYTYNQRLTSYPFIDIEGNPATVNQLDELVKKLVKEPLSKSAQAITWDPRCDHNLGAMGYKWRDYDSPCLQRIWFRLIPTAEGYRLNTNADWRSRDLAKAVPQNISAITKGLVEPTRKKLEVALGKPVTAGRYLDKSDSLHLYGHYFDPRKQGRDALNALDEIFRVSSGEPIENRLIIPGTDLHEMMREDVEREYRFRVENPDFGNSGLDSKK